MEKSDVISVRQSLSSIDHAVRKGILLGLSGLRNDALRFIQIGGNDGKMADPLFSFHSTLPWCGAIVEPVPSYFERLSSVNRSNNRLTLYNCAISDRAGVIELWRIKPDVETNYPNNFVGLASGNKQHLVNHGVLESHLESLRVESITPKELLMQEGNPERIDLLCVDVEGYELPIILAYPFMESCVEVVLFEAWHMKQDDRQILSDFCSSKGMNVFFLWEDGWIIAKNDDARSEFLRSMSELSKSLQVRIN